MSNKKQIAELTKRLSAGNDKVMDSLRIFKEVVDEINGLSEADAERSEETHGAVSTKLGEQSEKLEYASEALDDAIDEIESASGDALYCLQELE